MTRCSAMLAIIVTCLMCVGVAAETPKAVITGPKEARCGALVVLDATESVGTSRLWLLAVSPDETSFLPVESGQKCIFASPVAGRYQFVLVVAGTNTNGGAAAEMATHTVQLTGITPPPTPPPDPTDPPLPSPATAVTYVFEKDQHSPPRAVQAALDRINAAGSVVASIFEQDSTSGTGQVPAQYRAALAAAKAAGLPCLVVTAGDQVLRVVKNPQTEADVTEALQ